MMHPSVYPSSLASDFLRSKFVSSFCGALSAFSGTIGLAHSYVTLNLGFVSPPKSNYAQLQLRGHCRCAVRICRRRQHPRLGQP